MNDTVMMILETNEESGIEISDPSRLTAKPVVSVSMITYNHEQYIEEAINGVLMQETDFDVELIISNDNSPDQTDAIVQRIIKEHPKGRWIHYIKHEKNIGMMPNILDNLQRCNGEYIAICEGDDYWTDPLKLHVQIDAMKKQPACDLSFHPATVVSGLLKTDKVNAFHSLDNKIFTAAEMIKGGGAFCPSSALIFKRSILSSLLELLHDAPVGDYFIQVLGSHKGGALYLSRVMSIYRMDTAVSWTAAMDSSTEKMKIYFERFIHSLSYLNAMLKKEYQQEIDFIIEQEYYAMASSYLNNSAYEDYRLLFNEYYTRYSKRPIKMKVLGVVGCCTRSPRLTGYFNRLFF
ncbi:MAG: glycosyltransferase [Methylococcales bacterium]|nr:glycosyltransferase [Methylococcales bacterium]